MVSQILARLASQWRSRVLKQMAFSQDQADQFAREWIAAWNSHDLTRIMEHYHSSVVFTSPFVVQMLGAKEGVVQGNDLLKEYFAKALAAYPNLRFELYHAIPGLNSVVLYYKSVNDLLAAEVMELDSGHRVVKVVAHYKAPD
eukprot:SM000151S01498  [mRNA]  locus=s151:94307:95199:- [translate_table: standard]